MEKPKKTTNTKILVVRIRGKINLSAELKSTFEMLNLHKKNWCIVIENNPSMIGLLNKVKDYVTWGEISEEGFKELVLKKGEEFKARTEDSKSKIKYTKCFSYNKKNYKKYFRLNPPRKGYGRKGIKQTFNKGGALGYRGEQINDLLQRMM